MLLYPSPQYHRRRPETERETDEHYYFERRHEDHVRSVGRWTAGHPDFSLPTGRVASVAVPTLVIDGGTTPWMSHAAQATASALPNAHRRTLEGQPRNVDPEALAPTLMEFFADQRGA